MLNKILESCEYVFNNSKYVTINNKKLIEFVKTIPKDKTKHWLSSSPYGLLNLPVEDTINFLLIYESIDFSFWGEPKWQIEINGKKEDGAVALLYAILKYVKDNNTTDFSNITKDEFKYLLKGNIEIPLIEERYEFITNVSKIVNEKMDGNFYNYIKNVTTDTELFDIIIKFFPSFKDERIYNNNLVYLYKLAQLLTSDILHIRELKEKIKVDYSHLVGCADYKIPQVLRSLGILEYSKDLSDIIDNREEIEVNSIYEVEIRANMIVAIDIIKNKLGGNVYSIDINDYIWGQAKNKEVKPKLKLKLKPYHLTRCINY